jgi:8-oxo-dGTP pyrophosphatase MutT (NUDIX family)
MSLDRDDSPFDPADPTRPKRAPTPKDAATLILVRAARSGFEALMGQRAKGHVFMPDKWVFPGGRVERADAVAPAAAELGVEDAEKLAVGVVRRPPRAFALAAIRETLEEAGLLVGRSGWPGVKPPPGWSDFAAHDVAPDLSQLRFVARAITPPYRPRRFDARFFLARAEDVLLNERPIEADEELLHTRWHSFEEAYRLDLPNVTRFVLGEVEARLAGRDEGGPPFLRWTRQGHRMDRL